MVARCKILLGLTLADAFENKGIEGVFDFYPKINSVGYYYSDAKQTKG